MKKLLILFGMICFTAVSAQTKACKASYINALTNNSFSNKIEISFSAPKKLNNLLVLIADSAGHIVFLDNKINFKGTYNRVVDLKRKGNYYLKINDNDERISKTLIIE